MEVFLDGATASACVKDGAWEAVLPARSEGGPLTLEMTCGAETQRVEEVLIGEVLLCAGQSNMEVAVSSLKTEAEIVASANNPAVRIFMQDAHPVAAPARDVRNGRWVKATRQNAPGIPALPMLLALRLQEALGVPVGILVAAVGGSGIISWLPREVFERHGDLRAFWVDYPWHPDNEAAAYARWAAERAAHNAENERRSAAGEALLPWTKYLFFGPRGSRCLAQPAGLFNGEINPIARFAISGAVWYQGETDAEEPSQYERHLSELMASWREAWGIPELRFFVVQLVRCESEPPMVNWPALREAQARATEATSGASLVPALDLGDPADIHPADKALLGARLGRVIYLALSGAPVPEAPRISGVEKLDDGSVKVMFSQSVRAVGLEVGGFEAAGPDGVFRRVSARQLSPVSVRIEAGAEETDLRYLWKGVPEVNLFSEDGLPPLPFRTDTAPAPFHEQSHYMSAW